MKVLVINSGSSSLKYRLFDMTDESVLAFGSVEKIGIRGLQPVTYEPVGQGKLKSEENLKDHREALRHVLGQLSDPKIGVIKTLAELRAVGHRVLHGKEEFKESTRWARRKWPAQNHDRSRPTAYASQHYGHRSLYGADADVPRSQSLIRRSTKRCLRHLICMLCPMSATRSMVSAAMAFMAPPIGI